MIDEKVLNSLTRCSNESEACRELLENGCAVSSGIGGILAVQTTSNETYLANLIRNGFLISKLETASKHEVVNWIKSWWGSQFQEVLAEELNHKSSFKHELIQKLNHDYNLCYIRNKKEAKELVDGLFDSFSDEWLEPPKQGFISRLFSKKQDSEAVKKYAPHTKKISFTKVIGKGITQSHDFELIRGSDDSHLCMIDGEPKYTDELIDCLTDCWVDRFIVATKQAQTNQAFHSYTKNDHEEKILERKNNETP